MTPTLLAALMAARAAKKPVVLATRLDDGTQALVSEQGTHGAALPEALVDEALAALEADRSHMVEHGGRQWFLHVHNPPQRLVIVGAVHIAQALVPMAVRLGFAVTLIDPRGAFATEERFPGVTVLDAWPDEAIDELALDRRTAIVTLTHDPKLDDPALSHALKSDAYYIGALGSRKTHANRVARLGELGHGAEELRRIHGPIGLSIEATTAPEIALAILAEIVAVRRGAAIVAPERAPA